MSQTQNGAYGEQEGGYTIQRPPRLRAPTTHVVTDRSTGEQKVEFVPKSGDQSYSSLIGMPIGDLPKYGPKPGPAIPQRPDIAEPRTALADALRQQHALNEHLADLENKVSAAERDERHAAAMLSTTDNDYQAAWALWADNQAMPKPPDVREQIAEYTAKHLAATKTLEAARAALTEAQAHASEIAPDAKVAIESALNAVLLDEAEELASRYQICIHQAYLHQAALEGLRRHYIDTKQPEIMSYVDHLLTGGEDRVRAAMYAALSKERESVRQRFQNYPDKLHQDPDYEAQIDDSPRRNREPE